MYLVSADLCYKHIQHPPIHPPPPSPVHKALNPRIKRRLHHPYEKWVKFRKKISEDDTKRKKQIKVVADFLKKILPDTATSQVVSPKI